MNDVKSIVTSVMKSAAYKSWAKENPGSYVCCLFQIINSGKGWEVAFYSEKKNRMTSFSSEPAKILEKDAEVFKREETQVEELEIDKLTVGFEDSLKITQNVVDELGNCGKISREIVILQKIKKNLWNIICITDNMLLINVKIDAVTGEILKKDARSAMDLVDKEKTTDKK